MRELLAAGCAPAACGLLETGYFQPDYLARFGFRTDPASGGLVLDLGADAAVPH